MIYKYQCNSTTECHPITVELVRGRYLLECYGAEGGRGLADSKPTLHGGYGAYASGILNLKEKTTFYLYIGGKGEDGEPSFNVKMSGGWNGGGDSGRDLRYTGEPLPDTPGSGGGSTDIRLVKAEEGEESTNEESLDSRIIVAAGGSGSSAGAYGAPGGDLFGYKISEAKKEAFTSYVPSQSTGNVKGKGGNGKDSDGFPSSGAGGGYYGGKSGVPDTVGTTSTLIVAASPSGSSYVAGFPGCPEFTNNLGDAFDYQLINPHISNGFSYFPSVNFSKTKQYEKGHQGNGAIKITRLRFGTKCSVEKGLNNILFVSILVLTNSNTDVNNYFE